MTKKLCMWAKDVDSTLNSKVKTWSEQRHWIPISLYMTKLSLAISPLAFPCKTNCSIAVKYPVLARILPFLYAFPAFIPDESKSRIFPGCGRGAARWPGPWAFPPGRAGPFSAHKLLAGGTKGFTARLAHMEECRVREGWLAGKPLLFLTLGGGLAGARPSSSPPPAWEAQLRQESSGPQHQRL